MNVFALYFAHQLCPCSEVPPLIGASGLERHVMATIQFHEIHTLENLVRKLGIGNAFIRFQTGSYDFFSDHGADAIVLSNISQKVESGKVTSPVQVIDHGGTIVTLKRQIVLNLLAK